jgi:hypothetical protein
VKDKFFGLLVSDACVLDFVPANVSMSFLADTPNYHFTLCLSQCSYLGAACSRLVIIDLVVHLLCHNYGPTTISCDTESREQSQRSTNDVLGSDITLSDPLIHHTNSRT